VAVLSFLYRPKWIILALIVALLSVTFVSLGFWQLRRLDGVRSENRHILATRAQSVGPVAALVNTKSWPGPQTEYRQVRVTGHWDSAHEVIVRSRQIGEKNGAFILTPLITTAGPALFVVRGWVPAADTATAEPPVPAATSGAVTVVARLRAPETGAARNTRVGRFLSVTRIDPTALSHELAIPAYVAYAEFLSQQPEPTGAVPEPIPQGTLDEGNHESYAYQWFTFGLMAVGGYALLAVLEVRKRRRPVPGVA
jgi:cytochrome oxidase assembly protein ShyY1